jgi:hypothetical protein
VHWALGIPHFLENRYRAGSHSFEIVKKQAEIFSAEDLDLASLHPIQRKEFF